MVKTVKLLGFFSIFSHQTVIRTHFSHQVLSEAAGTCTLSGSWCTVSQCLARSTGCSRHPKAHKRIYVLLNKYHTSFVRNGLCSENFTLLKVSEEKIFELVEINNQTGTLNLKIIMQRFLGRCGLYWRCVNDLSSQVEHVCVRVIERKKNSCRSVQVFFVQRFR